MVMALMSLQPIYFYGWIIQPVSITGECVAYQRTDTRRESSESFGSILEAKRYIVKKVG